MYEIPRHIRCKNREKYTLKKNMYEIPRPMWFGNLPMSTKLQGFHYSQGKNTKCGKTVFSLSKTDLP